MNYCDMCEYAENCEYADGINFCDDCKYSFDCPIKTVFCKAGYAIECNNGWEDKDEYLGEEIEV